MNRVWDEMLDVDAFDIGGRPSAKALEPADGVWGARRTPRVSLTAGREAPEHWTGPQET